MNRRTPKPFTVEIRHPRRGQHSPTLIEAEQPRVEWPTALFDTLGEAPNPVVTDEPARRILPALDEPLPTASDPVRIPAAPMQMEPIAPVAVEPDVELAEEASAVSTSGELGVAPVTELRGRRSRIPRNDFPRAERWKARLPRATHGPHRKSRRDRA